MTHLHVPFILRVNIQNESYLYLLSILLNERGEEMMEQRKVGGGGGGKGENMSVPPLILLCLGDGREIASEYRPAVTSS